MKPHNALVLAAMTMFLISCGNPQNGNSEQKAAEQNQAAPAAQKENLPKIYDDSADPAEQIDKAIAQAQAEGKFVIAQVGGNWCPWCLRFADYISKDAEIAAEVAENFIYVHINVRKKNEQTGKNETCTEAMAKLGNPMRFGYPVMVVLDANGKVLHTQDSSYLESGESYDKDKVMRFFKNWKPSSIVQ